MTGYTCDTGALIALDRGGVRVRALFADAQLRGFPVHVPAGALAQAWRDPRRHTRLSRFVRSREVEPVSLDTSAARATGLLCAATGTDDVVDASVAVCARAHDDIVLTSDPTDMRRLIEPRRVLRI